METAVSTNAIISDMQELKERYAGFVEEGILLEVSPRLLVQQDGWNVRDYNSKRIAAHIEKLTNQWIEAPQMIPPLVVVFDRESEQLFVRDGHCRLRGALAAIEGGLNLQSIKCMLFEGTSVEQDLILITSQEGAKLDFVEVAIIYKRLLDFGFSTQKIAGLVSKTRQHVEQVLKIAACGNEIKALIKNENINYVQALNLIAQVGEEEAINVIKRIIERKLAILMNATAPESSYPSVPPAIQQPAVTKPGMDSIAAPARIEPAMATDMPMEAIRSDVSSVNTERAELSKVEDAALAEVVEHRQLPIDKPASKDDSEFHDEPKHVAELIPSAASSTPPNEDKGADSAITPPKVKVKAKDINQELGQAPLKFSTNSKQATANVILKLAQLASAEKPSKAGDIIVNIDVKLAVEILALSNELGLVGKVEKEEKPIKPKRYQSTPVEPTADEIADYLGVAATPALDLDAPAVSDYVVEPDLQDDNFFMDDPKGDMSADTDGGDDGYHVDHDPEYNQGFPGDFF
ncbi:ParB/RepB/Spo0J family partition protein [Aeromonas hydrophila]|uniref:ParB/RepB/Spo0J family partition protein n=1 Tax=Aeromonas hydrophila TaxID=644 RepID=UPI002B481F28|nr:hypothetical protein [Aeromonas hydrophila]